MKISRPHAPHPGLPGKAGALGASQGKNLSAKLGATGRAAGAHAAERSAAPHQPTPVSDIGAELKAGKITAQAALDKVVERVLDHQLGKQAGAALRAKVGAALRASLADDPLLAAKVRALGQD